MIAQVLSDAGGGRSCAALGLRFLQLAAEFRAQMASEGIPLPCDGWVYFYGALAAGWSLRHEASHWIPGTVSVSWDGHVHIAVGGGEYFGAHRWQTLATESSAS